MYNQSNLAEIEREEQVQVFQFPDMSGSSEFTQEDLEDDTNGVRMSFQRIKIAGGGSTMFELPGEDSSKPEYVPALQGVILYHHPANGYWVGEPTDDDKTPLCSSTDGKTGYGDPGGPCAACYLNRFGSGEDGKSKACKNMRHIYLLQSGDLMPMVLSLPPTSLKAFDRFIYRAFFCRNRPSYGGMVEISLHREEKPTAHAVADFRKLYDFTGEDLAKAQAFATAFRTQAKALLAEQAQANAAMRDDGYDYVGYPKGPKGARDAVIMTGETINGERDELPL